MVQANKTHGRGLNYRSENWDLTEKWLKYYLGVGMEKNVFSDNTVLLFLLHIVGQAHYIEKYYFWQNLIQVVHFDSDICYDQLIKNTAWNIFPDWYHFALKYRKNTAWNSYIVWKIKKNMLWITSLFLLITNLINKIYNNQIFSEKLKKVKRKGKLIWFALAGIWTTVSEHFLHEMLYFG